MRDSIQVILGGAYGPQQVGTFYPSYRGYHEAHAFAYSEDWLENPDFFDLDPYLEPHEGEQFTPPSQPMFGALRDTMPDRWGRMLLDRMESLNAAAEQRPIRTLKEVAYLLAVEDATRLGALRFSRDDGSFLKESAFPIPTYKDLRELAGICLSIDTPNSELEPGYASRLTRLVSASASLGGARPKATWIAANGELWIAKFPAINDDHDVGSWEFLLNQLAWKAKINVLGARLLRLGGPYSTFCVARFDRLASDRLMYASAMTCLEQQDGNDDVSYLDIAELISRLVHRKMVKIQLAQLFRRVVFNVLTGNRDDHLRNHGFLLSELGWELSPAFDMNPNPTRRNHVLRIDDKSAEPDLETVMATAEVYQLSRAEASAILDEVTAATSRWREEALRLRISRREIQMMEDAFIANTA